MKKKTSIFACITLSICLLLIAPLNAYASKLSISVNEVFSGSRETDPPNNGICSRLEGMAVGVKYIYTAKRDSTKKRVSIYRTKMSTGETVLLQFPEESNHPDYTDNLGYAGDMQVIEIGSQTTLMVATGTSIAQVKVDNKNNQLTIQKEYKLDNVDSILSIASDKQNSGVFYLRTSGFIIYKVTIQLSKSSSNTAIILKGTNIKKVCKLINIGDYGQGLAYYNGKLYLGMSTSSSSGNSGVQSYIGIYKIPSTYNDKGIEAQDLITLSHKGEIEGVDITGGYLYYSKKITDTTVHFPYIVNKSRKIISEY